MSVPTQITFFEFLTPLVASGQKTITIRDKSESHYVPGTRVEVFTLETQCKVCEIDILAVEPLKFDEINEFHAEQEAIELPKLKALIQEIYPNIDELYVITYQLAK
ncbi:N(4)-acetylcytidine aminohydrolase [Vibrio cholerae]|uniref:N(4)-acetylcytidine aminohydrolase n=1 Tax=Vibrio cholerae TaxID=666 RepID=UPI0011D7ACFB|nr:N(4)-acetylcytidine aminohydrolase [Vibrio cholerae]EGR0743480.1 ASCH domain-containing protein [Vibrio cholerae]EGR0754959.1 ASCH domain-containing protein [Vibrio cholerae]EGR0820362.1 ASCH domain-containing protein [Vibrio cholerae]EGR1310965.1 ASCH domain-containing protein [Vibrio cholerae]EHY8704134.1 ASCH domain-containing protein [Vibrio cholerae]